MWRRSVSGLEVPGGSAAPLERTEAFTSASAALNCVMS